MTNIKKGLTNIKKGLTNIKKGLTNFKRGLLTSRKGLLRQPLAMLLTSLVSGKHITGYRAAMANSGIGIKTGKHWEKMGNSGKH